MRLHNNTWGDIEDMKVEIRNLIEPLAINGEIHNKTVDKVAWVSWQLCEDCEKVWEYAEHRIDACPHMESKTFCSVCKTHCYAPNYREKIREIMRYGGPRMLLVSPIQVIRHMYLEWKDKKRG
ncbi:MAG: nitrous oxide-stimulated promoter family protein [Veillonella sp.]|nr:nitrous oxide-stimulated promoter family protein [Veillonella sp.]